MQKLSQQLATEKSTNERMKTTYSSQVSQQSTEFKKMTLELSKLKVHVVSEGEKSPGWNLPPLHVLKSWCHMLSW